MVTTQRTAHPGTCDAQDMCIITIPPCMPRDFLNDVFSDVWLQVEFKMKQLMKAAPLIETFITPWTLHSPTHAHRF